MNENKHDHIDIPMAAYDDMLERGLAQAARLGLEGQFHAVSREDYERQAVLTKQLCDLLMPYSTERLSPALTMGVISSIVANFVMQTCLCLPLSLLEEPEFLSKIMADISGRLEVGIEFGHHAARSQLRASSSAL